MRINTNMNALTALNSSTKTTALAGNSMEKLSSGLRINKAGDDAAGLAISEKMRAQIRGMEQADRNTQDGISLVQTAEGAMEEIGNIAQRMRELSVQAANETNTSEDRGKIVEELTQLHQEIDRIAQSTEFNGKSILNGNDTINQINKNKFVESKTGISTVEIEDGFDISKIGTITITTAESTSASSPATINVSGGNNFTVTASVTEQGKVSGTIVILDSNNKKMTITLSQEHGPGDLAIGTISDDTTYIKGKDIQLQVGANTSAFQKLNIKIDNVNTNALGLYQTDINAMKNDATDDNDPFTKMINSLDKALEKINTGRANLGAMQNRLETTSSNLTTSTENLTAAESRIRDVDVADEMMNLSKLNLINQAAQAMMVQAKSQPEGVMQLLR